MSTQLILVRHGLPHRVTVADGTPDPALTDQGLAQAAALAAALADEPITAVYASTLRRAAETARPLADRLGLPVRPDPDLVEITLGETAYVPFGQNRRTAGDQEVAREWARRLAEPDGVRRIAEFRERVCGRLAGIAAAHPDETVAVACHGGVISAYLTDVLGLADVFTFSFEYTGFSRVLIGDTGRRRVRSVNEHQHVG
jgi:probable phosphoglycerate mutase